MKNVEKYKNVCGRFFMGCFLVGSSGTGKTLFVRAVAGEFGVVFFFVVVFEFVELFVGCGVVCVCELFVEV